MCGDLSGHLWFIDRFLLVLFNYFGTTILYCNDLEKGEWTQTLYFHKRFRTSWQLWLYPLKCWKGNKVSYIAQLTIQFGQSVCYLFPSTFCLLTEFLPDTWKLFHTYICVYICNFKYHCFMYMYFLAGKKMPLDQRIDFLLLTDCLSIGYPCFSFHGVMQ